MNITVVGTGYVGLVTGVCLADINHQVTCLDIDEMKVQKLSSGFSPIYEPGLEELLEKNIAENRLRFTSNLTVAYQNTDVVYIAVGTPQKPDGSADLSYVENAAIGIADHIQNDVIVVIKSTVPVGTNDYIKEILEKHLVDRHSIEMVSNPEFLREGSAVKDTFQADRIVIGADHPHASSVLKKINQPFHSPVFETDIKSAEMIKYASNAFLATKISFINEISNICEKIGANIDDVSVGMGQDHRIGPHFLRAGIGYGGSCFPKDTNALVQIAGNVEHEFELLKSVIRVNNHQQLLLVDKARKRFGDLKGLSIAILGLSFKPDTDDMREAPSIPISKTLLQEGAMLTAYDPLAVENACKILPEGIKYVSSPEEALIDADAVFILTEWDQVRNLDLKKVKQLMNQAVIFDGRNVLSLNEIEDIGIEYHSIGRPSVL